MRLLVGLAVLILVGCSTKMATLVVSNDTGDFVDVVVHAPGNTVSLKRLKPGEIERPMALDAMKAGLDVDVSMPGRNLHLRCSLRSPRATGLSVSIGPVDKTGASGIKCFDRGPEYD